MSETLPQALAWIAPHAVLLALLLPAVSRVVGHLVPEELVMIVLGIVCADAPGPRAILVVTALFLGHFVADQTVFTVGSRVSRRIDGWPRISRRVRIVADRLQTSPWGLWALIPARVLPLGRTMWLMACGVVGISRRRFAAFDAGAVAAHVTVWCGLGWLLGDRASVVADVGRPIAVWCLLAAGTAAMLVWAWRRFPTQEPLRERDRRTFH